MQEFVLANLKRPSSEKPDAFEHRHSVFISRGHQIYADAIIGPPFGGEDSSAVELWSEATPDDEAQFHFQIGAELPFLLPEIDGPEQTFDIEERRLVLTNRMVRAYYGVGAPDDSTVQYMLVHRAGLDRVMNENRQGNYHTLPMKSFISSEFIAEAKSAHSALKFYLKDWIAELVQSASRLLDAFRMADPINTRRLTDITSPASFRGMWIAVDSD